jgi:DNA-binding XRE family transcriptional regulator
MQWRAEIGAKQVELAREAHVGQATISQVESGRLVAEDTQWKIFYALNRLRTQVGFPEIAFDEIDWPT